MNALLRYAFLKARRDGSLWAFIITPIVVPAASLIGSTVGDSKPHALHYPMFMAMRFTPVQNATTASDITVLMCILFACLPAFWTLRHEIESRSIGSLALAARPFRITIAAIIFAASLAAMASVISVLVIGALTAALPAHVGLIVIKIVGGALATSAIGMLAVTISPQPYMIACMYFMCLLGIGFFEKAKVALSLQWLAPLGVAIVCAVVAGFLLERRCES